jgi:hypothetical protein
MPVIPPMAAIQSVGRKPMNVPARPPASAPSGLVP